MDKVREALTTREVREAIGRFRGVAQFFEVGDMSAEADGNTLADAIEAALSAPVAGDAREVGAGRELALNDLRMEVVNRCINAASEWHERVYLRDKGARQSLMAAVASAGERGLSNVDLKQSAYLAFFAHLAQTERDRAARAPKQGGELREALLAGGLASILAAEVSPNVAGMDEWVERFRPHIDRYFAALSHESAEPAEERGPDDPNDLMAYWDEYPVTPGWCFARRSWVEGNRKGCQAVLLMRRAEVASRVGEHGTGEGA